MRCPCGIAGAVHRLGAVFDLQSYQCSTPGGGLPIVSIVSTVTADVDADAAAVGTAAEAGRSSAGRAPSQQARVYDFRKPTGLARTDLRNLQLILEVFTHRVGGSLTAGLATPVHMVLGDIHEETWDEYSSSLPEPTCVASLPLPPLPGRLFMHIPLPLAFAFVDLRLGGKPSGFAVDRALTDIEQELVRSVVDAVASELPPAFASLMTFRSGSATIVSGVRFLQGPGANEMCAVASLEISGGEKWTGSLSMCMSLGTLRPVVEAMELQELEGEDLADPTQAQTMADLVEEIPVDLSLQFPSVVLTPAELLSLEVGDVIPLDYEREKPLVLEVGREPLLAAIPTTRGRRLACVIVEPEERFI